MLKNIDVGIIGLGHMGLLHFMNCLHIDGIKIIAAADASKNSLKKAEKLGVKKLYTNYKDMLNDSLDLDAVIISLPNFLHFDSIKLSLENGFNVFIEKPLANSVEECKSILNFMNKNGRRLMIGHNYRYFDCIQKMKESSDIGRLGKLEVFTAELVINGPFSHPAVPKPVPEWWFDPEKTGGGVVHDLGYHLIDLYRYFVGEAEVAYSCLDYKMNFPMEDGAIFLLKSKESDTRGIFNVGWYLKTIFPRYNFRVILHGESGFITTDELIPRNLYTHAVKVGIKNFFKKIGGRKIIPLTYTYYYDSYYKELDHFFSCIRNDVDPDISAYDGLKTIEVIKEIYKKSNVDG